MSGLPISIEFQSTLLMRGATVTARRMHHCQSNFNPRSSCEERRDHIKDGSAEWVVFQSTLLMRGATVRASGSRHGDMISIHAPHARSDRSQAGRECGQLLISIHAPHARSDGRVIMTQIDVTLFQSTLLMRGATQQHNAEVGGVPFQSTLLMRGATRFWVYVDAKRVLISIHAPHARSDFTRTGLRTMRSYFNPRSSCEERLAFCRV